jgi:cytoskeletal protein CcmA (bactofilin family)
MVTGDIPRAEAQPRAQPNLAREQGSVMDEQRIAAWIGKSVIIKGDITSSQDLTIDGQVEGKVQLSDHSLTIGAAAAVTADLVGRTITISGTVSGDVTASEKVDLRATGHVNGDITAPRFVMEEGAIVTGRVDATGTRTRTTP